MRQSRAMTTAKSHGHLFYSKNFFLILEIFFFLTIPHSHSGQIKNTAKNFFFDIKKKKTVGITCEMKNQILLNIWIEVFFFFLGEQTFIRLFSRLKCKRIFLVYFSSLQKKKKVINVWVKYVHCENTSSCRTSTLKHTHTLERCITIGLLEDK